MPTANAHAPARPPIRDLDRGDGLAGIAVIVSIGCIAELYNWMSTRFAGTSVCAWSYVHGMSYVTYLVPVIRILTSSTYTRTLTVRQIHPAAAYPRYSLRAPLLLAPHADDAVGSPLHHCGRACFQNDRGC